MKNNLLEEDCVIGLIVYGGNARSLAMQAIDHAAAGCYRQSIEKMDEARDALNQAHDYQNHLMNVATKELELKQTSMLIMHGQDHLMSAISTIDLAERFIQLYQRLDKGEK
ncbi:PTS lactose/cellobiose transporter subunit IIA [Enterococcus sp. LJL99]